MVVVVGVALVLGVTLLWALFAEPAPPPPAAVSPRPAWTDLPTVEQVKRRSFPWAFGGYDRAAVDAHLDAVADALAVLRSAARMGTDQASIPTFTAIGGTEGMAGSTPAAVDLRKLAEGAVRVEGDAAADDGLGDEPGSDDNGSDG